MRWTDSEEDEPFASETEQRVAPLQLRCLQAETSPAELNLLSTNEHVWVTFSENTCGPKSIGV